MAAEAKASDGRKARRWFRRTLLALLALVLLLVVLLALAPSLVPAVFALQFETETGGKIEAQGLDLGWFSAQEVEHVRVRDPQGEEVADLSVHVPAKLINIVFGKRTIEPIRISGRIDLERHADGSLNLVRVFSGDEPEARPPAQPKPGGQPGIKLPGPWGGAVDISGVKLTYRDAGKPDLGRVTLTMQQGLVSYSPTTGVSIDIDADVEPGGTLTITGKTTTFAGADGILHPGDVRLETAVTATDVPAALVDSLAGAKGLVSAVTGQMLALQFDVKGGMGDAIATGSLTGPGLTSNLNFAWQDGVIQTASGDELLLVRTALREDVLRALATEQPLRLNGNAPGMTLAVRNTSVPYELGKPLDLRAARAAVVFDLEPVELTTGTEAVERLSMGGLHAEVSTDALADGVRVVASGAVAADGAQPGEIDVNVSLTNLLNDQGGLAPAQALAQGEAALRELPTSILQPLLAGLGIDAGRDIGPTLELSLRANRKVAQADADADVTLTIQAEHLEASAAAVLTGERVRSTAPARVRFGMPAALLEAYLPAEQGWRVAQSGTFELALESFDIPVDFAAAADTARLGATATLANLRLNRQDGAALGVPNLTLSLSQTDQAKQQRLRLSGSLAVGEETGTLDGAFTVDDPFGAAAAAQPWQQRLLDMRPAGEMRLSGVDVRPLLAGMAGGLPLNDLIAGPLTLGLRAEPRAAALAVSTQLDSQTLSGSIAGQLSKDAIATEAVSLRATVPQQALSALMAAYVPQAGEEAMEAAADVAAMGEAERWSPRQLSLLDPVQVEVTVQPWRLPLGESQERPPLRATVITPSPFRVAGLPADMEPLGLARVRIDADVTFAEQQPKPNLKVAAALQRPASETALAFVEVTLSSLLDAPQAQVSVRNLNVAQWEGLLKRERGSLVGFLGPSGEVAASLSRSGDRQIINAELNLKRLQGRLAGAIEANILELSQPASLSVIVAPEVLTDALAAALTPRTPQGGKDRPADAAAPPLVFDRATTAALTVKALKLNLAKPFDPTALAVDLSATADQVRGRTADEAPFSYRDLTLKFATEASGGTVQRLLADLTGFGLGQAAGAAKPAIDVHLAVAGLLDPEAGLTPAQAQLDGSLRVEELPVALVDSLAELNGVLQASLGASATADVELNAFSRESGSLTAQFDAPNTQFTLHGESRDGALQLTQPLQTSVRVSEAFDAMVLQVLFPMYGLQSQATDAPALLRLTNFRFPLDGDVRKLNGQFHLDLGEATYVLREPFDEVIPSFLARLNSDADMHIRQDLPPIDIAIDNGVLRYSGFPVEIGSFRMLFGADIDLTQLRGEQSAIGVKLNTEVPLEELSSNLRGEIGNLPLLRDLLPDDLGVPVSIAGQIKDLRFNLDGVQLEMERLPDEIERKLKDASPVDVLDQLRKKLGG